MTNVQACVTYREQLRHALEKTIIQTSQGSIVDMEAVITCFRSARKAGSFVYFIGNGGSAGIAMHMTADFLKNGQGIYLSEKARKKFIIAYEKKIQSISRNGHTYRHLLEMQAVSYAEAVHKEDASCYQPFRWR